jgi:hypothetical protein
VPHILPNQHPQTGWKRRKNQRKNQRKIKQKLSKKKIKQKRRNLIKWPTKREKKY